MIWTEDSSRSAIINNSQRISQNKSSVQTHAEQIAAIKSHYESINFQG